MPQVKEEEEFSFAPVPSIPYGPAINTSLLKDWGIRITLGGYLGFFTLCIRFGA